MKRFMVLALVLCARYAVAETPAHEDFVHLTAHMGASYAINTFMYGFSRKALHFDRTDALIFSAFTTLFVGAMWKVMEQPDVGSTLNGAEFKTSMLRNALGVGLSAGTVLMFDF